MKNLFKKLTFSNVVMLLAVLAVSYSCNKEEVVETRAFVNGKVIDNASAAALSGVDVSYYVGTELRTAATSDNGLFAVEGLLPGSAVFTFGLAGYETKTVTADIPTYTDHIATQKKGGSVAVQVSMGDVRLAKLDATLKGRVLYQTNTGSGIARPYAGATVAAVINGFVYKSSEFTDTEGRFSISNLPAGYELTQLIALPTVATDHRALNLDLSRTANGSQIILVQGAEYELGDMLGTFSTIANKYVIATNFDGFDVEDPKADLTVTFVSPVNPNSHGFEVTLAGDIIPAGNLSWSGNTLTITPVEALRPGGNALNITNLFSTEGENYAVSMTVNVANPKFYLVTSNLLLNNNHGVENWKKNVDANTEFSFTLTYNENVDAERSLVEITATGAPAHIPANVSINDAVISVTVSAGELKAGKTYTVTQNVWNAKGDKANNTHIVLKFETKAVPMPAIALFAVDTTAFKVTLGNVYKGDRNPVNKIKEWYTSGEIDTLINFDQTKYNVLWELHKDAEHYQVQAYSSITNTWKDVLVKTVAWTGQDGEHAGTLLHKEAINVANAFPESVLNQKYPLMNGGQLKFRVRAMSANTVADSKSFGPWTGLTDIRNGVVGDVVYADKKKDDQNRAINNCTVITGVQESGTLNNTTFQTVKAEVKVPISLGGGDKLGNIGSAVFAETPTTEGISITKYRVHNNGEDLVIELSIEAKKNATGKKVIITGITDSSGNGIKGIKPIIVTL